MKIVQAFVIALAGVVLAAGPAAAQGETWEHTMQGTASGISMPAQTMTACQATGAERNERPAPQMPDESCKMTVAQAAGSRTSFTVTCTQPEPMTGTGEVTWDGQNSYSATMTMTSADGTMTMKTSGKRLGAACDPRAEAKPQLDKFAGMPTGADMAKACAQSAAEVNPALFSGAPPVCTDSALLCKNFRTEAGFAKAGGLVELAGDVCKVNPVSLRADLCGTALKNESLTFLSSSCPDQSKVIVQRECAGRKFTSDVSDKYQSFCAASFAATIAAGGAATAPASTTAKPAPTPADVKGGAVEGAKRRLGGLLGR